MLLLIAFACFFLLFAAWLIVPTVHGTVAAEPAREPAPQGTAKLSTQV